MPLPGALQALAFLVEPIGLKAPRDGAIAVAQQRIVPLLFGHELVRELLRRLVAE